MPSAAPSTATVITDNYFPTNQTYFYMIRELRKFRNLWQVRTGGFTVAQFSSKQDALAFMHGSTFMTMDAGIGDQYDCTTTAVAHPLRRIRRYP